MLDADDDVRLDRLLNRQDIFDQTTSFKISSLTNLPEIPGIDPAELARASKIIDSEKANYNSEATKNYLLANSNSDKSIYINTNEKAIPHVVDEIAAWLKTSSSATKLDTNQAVNA